MDILDEIKADAKDEQLLRVLMRYGQPLMIGLIIAISLFAAYVWWDGRNKAIQESWGDQFFKATQLSEQHNTKEAMEQFKVIADQAVAPYQSLARIFLANMALNEHSPLEAVKYFDAVAAEEGTKILGYFAATRSAEIMQNNQIETGQTLYSRLSSLDRDTNPWQNQVRLMKTLLAYEKNDTATALYALNEMQKSSARANGTFATLLNVFAKKLEVSATKNAAESSPETLNQ